MRPRGIKCGLLALIFLAVFPSAKAQDGAQRVIDYAAIYNAANKAFAEGRFEEAARGMEDLRGVVEAKPEDYSPAQAATIQYLLGAAYFNLPDYPKAIDAFRIYLQKFPTSEKGTEVKLALAQALFFNKEFEKAIQSYQQLELIPAFRADALNAQARCYKELNRPKDQIRTLEKLIPSSVATREQATGALELIELYAANGQGPKALKLIQSLAARVELLDNIVAFNSTITKFADELAAQGNYEGAISGYRAVRSRADVIRFQNARIAEMGARMQANLRSGAGNAQAIASAVQANAAIKVRQAEAKKLLEEFEKLPPFDAALLLRQARAWYDWGRKWESMVVADRVLKKFPDDAARETALYMMIVAAAEVNEAERAQKLCEQYLKEFPQGANAETVGYLAGAVALQAGDSADAESYFGRVLEQQPRSQYRETIRFQLGNARFSGGDFPAAVAEYKRYLSEFPQGAHAVEAEYRIALADLFSGKYEQATVSLNAWLQKHPDAALAADCRYRLMVCDYAGQNYPAVTAAAAEWQKRYAGTDMHGEMLSLLGDTQAATNDVTGAIESYRKSVKKAVTDEVLDYSLMEAAKLMQKHGQWVQISEMFEEFVKDRPEHPTAVTAMSWIGKAQAHEGKVDEAKQFMVDQLQKYIGEPRRETVEVLGDLLALLWANHPLAKVAPVVATPVPVAVAPGATASAPTPAPKPTPPPYDAFAELDRVLAPLTIDANQTTRARLLYTKAQLARLRKNEAEYQALNLQIANQFLPEELSPLLLANAGDALLANGEVEPAAKAFKELKEFYPNSVYRDTAFVGLGEIALQKKSYAEALELFTDAANLAGAKVKEATIGEAKALLELQRYDESNKLFEQIAGMRDWRGESTAEAIYAMGDIAARQQKWAEAANFYQRVFVLHQRYLPWVAKAYIGAAESFDKLGKRPEAVGHLKEMLRNEKLRDFPETKRAKEMLHGWGEAT